MCGDCYRNAEEILEDMKKTLSAPWKNLVAMDHMITELEYIIQIAKSDKHPKENVLCFLDKETAKTFVKSMNTLSNHAFWTAFPKLDEMPYWKQVDFYEMPKNMKDMLEPVIAAAKNTSNNLAKRANLSTLYWDVRFPVRMTQIPQTIKSVTSLKTDCYGKAGEGYLYTAAAEWSLFGAALHNIEMCGDFIDRVCFTFRFPRNEKSSVEDLIFATGIYTIGLLVLMEFAFRKDRQLKKKGWGKEEYTFLQYMRHDFQESEIETILEAISNIIDEYFFDIECSFPTETSLLGICLKSYDCAESLLRRYNTITKDVLCRSLYKSRTEAGLTQKKLSQLTGISEATICNIEKNRRKSDDIEPILIIFRAINWYSATPKILTDWFFQPDGRLPFRGRT